MLGVFWECRNEEGEERRKKEIESMERREKEMKRVEIEQRCLCAFGAI